MPFIRELPNQSYVTNWKSLALLFLEIGGMQHLLENKALSKNLRIIASFGHCKMKLISEILSRKSQI